MTDFKSLRPIVACMTILAFAMLFLLSPAAFQFALVTGILFVLTLYTSVCARIFFQGSPMFGPSQRVPAVGIALFFPLIFLVFGDAFLPIQQLTFPTFGAIAIAIYVAAFDTRGYGIEVNEPKPRRGYTMQVLDVSGSMSSDRLL